MQAEHLQKMHASATKLMIMSVIPERPYSADSHTRALRAYQKEIDFFKSTMHGEAKEKKARMKNMKSLRTKSIEGIEGIEERGEGEEDEKPNASSSTNNMLSLGMPGSQLSQRFTTSNMNLMKNQLEGKVDLDEQKSFSHIECKYLVSLLKNRSV